MIDPISKTQSGSPRIGAGAARRGGVRPILPPSPGLRPGGKGRPRARRARRTSPDIYQAGKTYVEAAWDLSDVPDLCRHYLAHPEEAREIIRNGRAVLSGYYEGDGFVHDVRRILAVASQGSPVPVAGGRRVPALA